MMKRYPEYKDAGVKWLGEVPAHWNCHPFKFEIERNDGGVWGEDPDGEGDTIVLRSTEQTVDGGWRIEDPALRKLADSEKSTALLALGDLVVTKASGSSLHIGKTALVSREVADLNACYSNFMQRIRMKKSFDAKLAWYFMNSRIARAQFDVESNSTTGLANLNGTIIANIQIPVPPSSEQSSIVAFLDRETEKIDALIAEQEQLIALLKEKRQAVISHAVSKGLDPNAPLKDSGVEWLGDVPAHWEVRRIGTLFREAIEQGNDALPILSVSIHDGVSDRELSDDEVDRKVTRSDDRSKYKIVRPGDLAYNMMRAWQGGFGAVLVDGMVSPAYVVARPIQNLETRIVEHLLRTPQAVEEMRRHSKGVTDFRLRLYWDEFKDLRIALPTLEEQRAVLSYIDRFDSDASALVESCESAIALLEERRSALISATVTGKIDVRGLVPQTAEAA